MQPLVAPKPRARHPKRMQRTEQAEREGWKVTGGEGREETRAGCRETKREAREGQGAGGSGEGVREKGIKEQMA